MRMHLSAGIVASIVALFVAAFSGNAFAMPPVEAFGNLPVVDDAAIAPDGKHLAIIRPLNGRPGVTIFQLDSPNTPPKSFGLPNASAESVYWPNNTRLLSSFVTSAKLQGTFFLIGSGRFISIAADAAAPAIMLSDMPKDNYWGAEFAGQDASDPNHIFLESYETAESVQEKHERNILSSQTGTEQFVSKQYYWDLFKVDVTDGTSQLVRQGGRDTTGFILDKSGTPVGHLDDTPDDMMEHLFIGGDEVLSYDMSTGRSPFLVEDGLETGTGFTVTAYGPNGKRGLFAYNLGDKQPGQPIYTNDEYDVNNVLRGPRARDVIGVSYIADKIEYRYFDPTRQKVQERLEKALTDQSVQLVSWDSVGANYVVKADGPKHPTTYYLFSPANGQLSPIASAYPGLTVNDLGDESAYPYKSRDGFDIHAYLTLPPGKTPKNLPTVIFVHHGPEARDKVDFNWWAQFMASRGYAVLQPNYRGSEGYGQAFRDAGDGEWAGKIQTDVADGVQKLVADGIADPKRICIVGWGFGGYEALAGVTFSPDLYACAISVGGISDLTLLVGDRATYFGNHATEVAYLTSRIGSGRFQSSKLEAMSPDAHADQVKAPVLLIHSTKDLGVLINQSEAEESALRHAGKAVEFVKTEGDLEEFTLAPTRMQLLKEVERFLAAHIGT
jgi:dipeptidyl aminopeptidase/acylaminoacyl peptidase